MTASSLLLLAGCVGSADTGKAPKADKNHTVQENGNGRIEAGESMAIPSNVTQMVEAACSIIDSKKLTAVNAQQLAGFGQFMGMFAKTPASIHDGLGIKTVDEAAELSTKYTAVGGQVYEITKSKNIAIPADLKAGFAAVCAGDVFAIS